MKHGKRKNIILHLKCYKNTKTKRVSLAFTCFTTCFMKIINKIFGELKNKYYFCAQNSQMNIKHNPN